MGVALFAPVCERLNMSVQEWVRDKICDSEGEEGVCVCTLTFFSELYLGFSWYVYSGCVLRNLSDTYFALSPNSCSSVCQRIYGSEEKKNVIKQLV